MKNFDESLSEKSSEAWRIVSSFLPIDQGRMDNVVEAMNYSVEAGGKRLRPLLMMECYRAFNGSGKVIEPFMAAIEFIHTYSLIHDDLPQMDNDEMRRGQPATHVKFGPGMATLAGDGLLNYAFETALRGYDREYLGDDSKDLVTAAMKLLFSKSGLSGMLGGQALDVYSEKNGVLLNQENIDYIYKNKTAALFEAAGMVGAILAAADESQVSTLRDSLSAVGYAFQIADDILDIEGDAVKLGKPIGSDEKNGKNTYVSLVGIEQSKKDVEKLTNEAISGLEKLDIKGDSKSFLRELFMNLIGRAS
ncbi:MAG: polyprenyl synthetase family protein [Lachnospiraceae bacterium]|nr:polyprenyl synthetase family protein [Lachnospiraceae bacterium]